MYQHLLIILFWVNFDHVIVSSMVWEAMLEIPLLVNFSVAMGKNLNTWHIFISEKDQHKNGTL